MNRYDYLLSKIEAQKEQAVLQEKGQSLIIAFSLIEKCYRKQKSSKFKVTVPYIPSGIYGKNTLNEYNFIHKKKLKFKNMRYRYLHRHSLEIAAKLCGFEIIDEVNYFKSKKIKVTYIFDSFSDKNHICVK